MLLILPKIFFFTCYILTSCKSSKNEPPTFTDLQTNGAKELFSYEYFAFSNNPCLIQSNMSLYALSKLKLRNHRSFFHYVLLLSGDVNLHPGPIQYPCGKCMGAVRKKIIYCEKCKFWFHKKCEIDNENIRYQELLHSPNKPAIYTCKNCSQGVFDHLPFLTKI